MNAKTQIKVPDTTEDQSNKAAESALVVQPVGGALQVVDFGEDAGVGMENVDRSEYKIPFVRIIQAGSPQAKPISVGGLALKPGTIFNLGSNESFDGERGVTFIPVKRDHNFPEFIPRNPDGSGGGFVGIRSVDDELVLRLRAEQGQFGRLKTSENTELGETFYLYGLIVSEDGSVSNVVIGFAATQIKKFQTFMTRYMGITYQNSKGDMIKPPLWAHKLKLTTVYEQKGTFSWYGWRIQLVEEPAVKSLMKMTDPLYQMGKEFHNSLKSGTIQANYTQAGEATDVGLKADEVPF